MSYEPRLRTSTGPRRSKITPLQSGNHSKSVKGLPPIDNENTPTLKQAFKGVIDAVSIFLTHNSETVSFHSSLSKQITEIDGLFGEFHANLSRTTNSKRQSQSSTNTPAKSLVSAALPFFRSFEALKSIISQISSTGTKSIEETVEASFSCINETLNYVRIKSDDCGSIDPIIKRLQTMSMILSPIKTSVIQILRKQESPESQGRLTTELRNYSRTINSAFRNEFSTLQINANEVEALRLKAYNACSDIIYGMKSILLFEEDISRVLKYIQDFEQVLEKEAKRNGLYHYLGPQKPENQETVLEFNISKYPDLSDLLRRLCAYIRDGGEDKKFIVQVLEISSAKAVLFEEEDIESMKKRIVDLEKSITQMKAKEKTSNLNNDFSNKLRSTVMQSIDMMKMKANQMDVHVIDDNEIIPTFNNLLNQILEEQPKKVEMPKDTEFEKEIMNLFAAKSHREVIEKVHKIQHRNEYLESEYEKFSNAQTQKLRDRICLLSQSLGVQVSDSDVETIDKISDYVERQKEDHQKIANLFQIDGELIYNGVESIYSSYKSILTKAEQKLKDYLNMTPECDSLTQSVSNMLDKLDSVDKSTSYKTLNQVYSSLLPLAGIHNAPTILHAGKNYISQFEMLIEAISQKISPNQNSKLTSAVKQLHQKIGNASNQINTESDGELIDLIEESLKNFDIIVEKLRNSITDGFVRKTFKAKESEEPLSILMDRAARLEILESSLVTVRPLTEILERSLGTLEIGSDKWFTTLRENVVEMNNALNNIASSKINSTIFLLLSRFISLLSSIVPVISPTNSRKHL
ncbi:hypothetical protein TVAG_056040 [Trichomonas vaginalis G3]|uniref:Uncharacterized protein n=1 Tax=Trichomonas vaginalis (strain ATCC PRA-98 / G3) TaxID=412133 RepID=A2EL57_TRIV3|nr:WD40 repeat-containing protein [Trichomonas vaginalis G3]EAY06610.1 hypothetical protein TVAG_056040 [Trichomonas vaginalis G3]KAI5551652.1 WD40 repeat-containing protein [Trichomonas vaginalis G3]|eukprot:XP_001318833.1 hypothetical protein [Trichomonas vaginalis G3]